MKKLYIFTIILLLAACRPFNVNTPSTFVELDEDSSIYDYRATSADGVVVGIRAIDHEPEGNLQFWTESILNKMRLNLAYELIEERDITGGGGIKGKQLKFGIDRAGHPFRYWLTIYVTEKYIYIIEAGGRQEDFERHMADIDRMIQSFRPE